MTEIGRTLTEANIVLTGRDRVRLIIDGDRGRVVLRLSFDEARRQLADAAPDETLSFGMRLPPGTVAALRSQLHALIALSSEPRGSRS